MAKVIWQKATSLVVCKRNLVDSFYHIRQMAVRVAMLVLGCIWDPHFGGREVVRGQRWYHSKERLWFPIGSPLWPLRSLTIRRSMAIECLRRSNQQRGRSIWGKIWGGRGLTRISACIDEVAAWMRSNWLQLNTAKKDRVSLVHNQPPSIGCRSYRFGKFGSAPTIFHQRPPFETLEFTSTAMSRWGLTSQNGIGLLLSTASTADY